MSRNRRLGLHRLGRLATVLGAAMAFALTAVPDAQAKHRDDDSDSDARYEQRHRRTVRHGGVVVRYDDRDRRYHRRGHDRRATRHFRHGDHDRHDRHVRSHRHRYDRGHLHRRHHGPPAHARVVRVHDHGKYYCKPCRHYFKKRHAFHDHLHDHHHVPLWRLPFVIVHSAIGWIFYG